MFISDLCVEYYCTSSCKIIITLQPRVVPRYLTVEFQMPGVVLGGQTVLVVVGENASVVDSVLSLIGPRSVPYGVQVDNKTFEYCT